MSYCSESDSSSPVFIKWLLSTAAVAEKAQHDPHEPWSFIGFTAPFYLQSIESGTFVKFSRTGDRYFSMSIGGLKPRSLL